VAHYETGAADSGVLEAPRQEVTVPKRRTPRQRKAAAEAARREAHARLVVKRSTDHRYVQRQRSGNDVVVSMPDDSLAAQELREALEEQRERFRQQFGREMEPDDPLFWDPDSAEPTPITEGQMRKDLQEWAGNVAAAGLDPAPALAMRDLGYMVMEETQHLFSLAELDAFNEAVEYYRAAADPLSAPPFFKGSGSSS
jgi:hypothetical protein